MRAHIAEGGKLILCCLNQQYFGLTNLHQAFPSQKQNKTKLITNNNKHLTGTNSLICSSSAEQTSASTNSSLAILLPSDIDGNYLSARSEWSEDNNENGTESRSISTSTYPRAHIVEWCSRPLPPVCLCHCPVSCHLWVLSYSLCDCFTRPCSVVFKDTTARPLINQLLSPYSRRR